jgi:hypothetical protein
MSTVLKKGAPSRSYPSRQRKLGPAPFASFEDLSDELESPADGGQAAGDLSMFAYRYRSFILFTFTKMIMIHYDCSNKKGDPLLVVSV